MMKYKRIFALVLSVVMILSCAPFAFAAPAQNYSATGGWTNPVYEGRVQASRPLAHSHTYYGTEPDATYITDAAEASAAIRAGMVARQAEIPLHYIIPEILPADQGEMEARLEQIILDLWDGVFIETDQPTEGDSLQYSWRSLAYGFSGTAYPALGYTEADFTLYVTYYTTAAQEQELTEAVDALIASFGFTEATTERQKVDAIYGWLCENVTYDNENLEDESYTLKFTAYAAMLHKTAVCEGYAVLFYRLAEEVGLDARVITGTAGVNNENHAWNIVQLGDYYYYLDPTWDAGSTPADYEYYLKGHGDFYGHINEPQYDAAEFRERYPIPALGLTTGSSTEFVSGNWEFTIANGLAVITGYTGSETEITVPASFTITAYVNGVLGDYTFPVYSVAAGVFDQNETVESITVAEGISRLLPGAIFGCDHLKELNLPSTLKMESYGFSSITEAPESCYALETLTVAPGNPYIRLVDGVLYTADRTTLLYCPPMNGITALTVPDGVEVIGTSAFAYHTTLQKLILPASVKELGHWALNGTESLQEVQMPGVERIGQYAIATSGLKHLSLPAGLRDLWHGALNETKLQTITVDPANGIYRVENGVLIGEGVAHKFALGTQNQHLIIPADVTKIEGTAFADADQLKEITFPAGLKEIGSSAFSGCDALEHVALNDGLEKIDNYAFISCEMLVSILIPASVHTIGSDIHRVNGQQDNITIYGAEGSAAQTYAIETGRNFKTIDRFVCAGGHTLVKTLLDEYCNELTDVFHYVCSVCGDHTQQFTVIYDTLIDCEYEIEAESFTYTGQPHRPAISNVKDGKGNLLQEGVHYEIIYGANTTVNDGIEIWIRALGNYRGNEYIHYAILPADISKAQITVNTPEYEYDATSKYPDVSVVWNGNLLTKYDDFGLLYEDNIQPGTAYAIVSGVRNFTGEVRVPFTIKEHTHRWGAWMSANETRHARQCLDNFCLEWAYADHIYDNACDTECNTCYHIRTVPHCYTLEQYESTTTVHWLICDWCGAVNEQSIAGHTGGNATCEQKKQCEICEAEYDELASHKLKQFWDEENHWVGCEDCDHIEFDAKFSHYDSTPPSVCGEMRVCDSCSQEFGEPLAHNLYRANDGTHHWDDCRYCDYKENIDEHTGGVATCMKQADCAVCGAAYGAKGDHNFQRAYTETKHYWDCITPGCNETTPKEEHTGGAATCTQQAVCQECNQPYGAAPGHDLELIAIPGSTNHYYDCKNCDHTEGGAPHYGGTATCQNKAACDLCGVAYGAIASHSWQSGWMIVSGGHAHQCVWCTANSGVYPHTGGTATCKTKATCTACGAAYGGYGNHKFSNNKCDTKCSTCGVLQRSAHSYGAYTYNNDATATADGTQTRRCGICGHSQTVTAPGTKLKNPFTDVPMAQYYATPVLWAVERGITNGMSATSFAPDATCTRGQIVTFLWRAAGSPEPRNSRNPFVDVPSNQYYYKAVLWAVEQGITNGLDATHFGPDASCTRGQIVTFLWRSKNKPSVSSANPFGDVSGGAYYYSAVLWAVKNGITNGMSATSFAPDAPCTRGQIVTFLYRSYN